MILKSLELKDFRNYESLNIEFVPGNNIIFGENAQGKTNLLEACFLCASARSPRGSRDNELIRFGADEAHIKTVISKENSDERIDIHLKKGAKKGIALNQIPLKKASDLFGVCNIILFSPEDLEIIKKGPDMRRRFMDIELCRLDRIYLNDLLSYRKVLEQRNSLLKKLIDDPRSENADTLDTWDIQLVSFGEKIIKRRREFIKNISPTVSEIHKRISGNREEPVVVYKPDVSEQDFSERLFMARDRDKRMAITSVGPHRDDIEFMIEKKDIRVFGSEGQKRTAALSLKLSEIETVRTLIKEDPILLLDDVLSELDRNRQNLLLSSISNVQTLITCTGLDDFVNERFHTDRVIKVVAGKVQIC